MAQSQGNGVQGEGMAGRGKESMDQREGMTGNLQESRRKGEGCQAKGRDDEAKGRNDVQEEGMTCKKEGKGVLICLLALVR